MTDDIRAILEESDPEVSRFAALLERGVVALERLAAAQETVNDRVHPKSKGKEVWLALREGVYSLARKYTVLDWTTVRNHPEILEIADICQKDPQWNRAVERYIVGRKFGGVGDFKAVEVPQGKRFHEYEFLEDSRHCAYELIRRAHPRLGDYLEARHGEAGMPCAAGPEPEEEDVEAEAEATDTAETLAQCLDDGDLRSARRLMQMHNDLYETLSEEDHLRLYGAPRKEDVRA